jgi:hypothetical protein
MVISGSPNEETRLMSEKIRTEHTVKLTLSFFSSPRSDVMPAATDEFGGEDGAYS